MIAATAQVKINVRMREPLRAAIERDATTRGISMNAAIVDRLERSFDREQTLAEAIAAAFECGKRAAEDVRMFDAALHASVRVVHEGEIAADKTGQMRSLRLR